MTARPHLRFHDDYVCPGCRSALEAEQGRVLCRGCDAVYPVEGGVPDLVDDDAVAGPSAFYERVFDRAAAVYESPLWYPTGIRLGGGTSVEALVDWVADRVEAGDAVVDAPTGTGLFARDVAPVADRVHGVDIARGMLRRAQRTARRRGLANYALARARVERLPFADGRFDAAVCTGALYLLDDPVEALAELRRVTGDDGRLLGMTVVAGGPLASDAVRRVYEAATRIDVATVGEVEDWLADAGFAAPEMDRSGAILLFDAPPA